MIFFDLEFEDEHILNSENLYVHSKLTKENDADLKFGCWAFLPEGGQKTLVRVENYWRSFYQILHKKNTNCKNTNLWWNYLISNFWPLSVFFGQLPVKRPNGQIWDRHRFPWSIFSGNANFQNFKMCSSSESKSKNIVVTLAAGAFAPLRAAVRIARESGAVPGWSQNRRSARLPTLIPPW